MPAMGKRIALGAAFLLVVFFSGWGLVENAWLATMAVGSSNREGFARRAEGFGIVLLVCVGLAVIFGLWKLSQWLVHKS